MRRRQPIRRVKIIFWRRAEMEQKVRQVNMTGSDGTAIVEKVNQAVRHSHVHRTMDKKNESMSYSGTGRGPKSKEIRDGASAKKTKDKGSKTAEQKSETKNPQEIRNRICTDRGNAQSRWVSGRDEMLENRTRSDGDKISLCRGLRREIDKNASMTKSKGLLSCTPLWRRGCSCVGLLLVPQLPEVHQSTQSAALFLGLFGHITRRLLLLVEFTALRVRSANQFRQTSQAGPLGGVRLTGPSVNSCREGSGSVSRQTGAREEGS